MIDRIEDHLRAVVGGEGHRRTPADAGPVVNELLDPEFLSGRLLDVRAQVADRGNPEDRRRAL